MSDTPAAQVISTDGTSIGYERSGSGPAVIVVDGALCYRDFGPSRKIAEQLDGFTTYVYDRRGRGASGAGESRYEPAREVADVAALIEAAGGSAALLGISSGGILAADAACALGGVRALAVYEPPLAVDSDADVPAAGFAEQLHDKLDTGHPAAAVRMFLRATGTPGPAVAALRLSPLWKKLLAVAPTLPNDFAIIGDTQSGRPLPSDRWTTLAVPAVVLTGGASSSWVQHGGQALADLLGAEHQVLPKQTHNVKPEVLGAAVAGFLTRG